jgi:hypothetical protein
MPLGILFWVLMVLWLIFGIWSNRVQIQGGQYQIIGGNLLLFILLFILGWRVFGFIIQG